MELKTKIKASSINNLSDGRYFATFAEWMGFNFSPTSPQFVTLEQATQIKNWVFGPRLVGEFDALAIDQINPIVEALQIDTIQTDLDLDFRQLSPIVSTIIRRIVIDKKLKDKDLSQIIEDTANGTAYFLLDFLSHQITWQDLQNSPTLSTTFLQKIAAKYPQKIILSMPFTPQNVLGILDQIQPFALSLAGGNELKTGLRAFDDIDPIVNLLEIEEDDGFAYWRSYVLNIFKCLIVS